LTAKEFKKQHMDNEAVFEGASAIFSNLARNLVPKLPVWPLRPGGPSEIYWKWSYFQW